MCNLNLRLTICLAFLASFNAVFPANQSLAALIQENDEQSEQNGSERLLIPLLVGIGAGITHWIYQKYKPYSGVMSFQAWLVTPSDVRDDLFSLCKAVEDFKKENYSKSIKNYGSLQIKNCLHQLDTKYKSVLAFSMSGTYAQKKQKVAKPSAEIFHDVNNKHNMQESCSICKRLNSCIFPESLKKTWVSSFFKKCADPKFSQSFKIWWDKESSKMFLNKDSLNEYNKILPFTFQYFRKEENGWIAGMIVVSDSYFQILTPE